ncbi:MAG TPA: prefoldin subunit beta [Desulfurococcales archaeon]|nr:prefoldin subunit beta [Desulfurococcales archaeon]
MAEQIPPELQNRIMHLQQLQNQLNMIRLQKQSVELELREVERVLRELQSIPANEILYKSLGHILVKTTKEKVEKELNERKEILELRLETLKRQEKHIETQFNDIRRKVTEELTKIYKVKQAS